MDRNPLLSFQHFTAAYYDFRMASKTLAIILGAGPGTGQAIATAFAARHSVALLARNKDSLQAVRDEVVKSGGDVRSLSYHLYRDRDELSSFSPVFPRFKPASTAFPPLLPLRQAHAFTCDASSSDSIDAAFTAIKQQFPDHKITTGIFNANSPFIVKPFLELKKEDVDPGVNINFYGAFFFSQKLIPLLLASGTPSFLAFTGATAALKGPCPLSLLVPIATDSHLYRFSQVRRLSSFQIRLEGAQCAFLLSLLPVPPLRLLPHRHRPVPRP